MHFPLPAPVAFALSRLEACGHQAYVVGGCVRDVVLGKQPHEYDLCTSARPEEVHLCFAGERVLDTGLKHGTVTLIAGGMPLEITTFRSDGTYSDGRRPDSVRFSTSIEEDLKRRDFTANAMAYSPVHGLVDPYDGVGACRDRRLIAVGDPMERFGEDALRILRALRFSAALGFEIDPITARAMQALAPTMDKLSRERVARELNLTLLGEYAPQALRLSPHILFAVLPQLAPMLHTPQRTRMHRWDLWEHTLQTIGFTPRELPLRWAALLHDSGKASTASYDADGTTHFRGHPLISARIADECLSGLKQSRQLQEAVHTLVRHHDDRVGPDNLQKWLSRLGLPMMRNLLLLQHADLSAHAPQVAAQADRSLALIQQAEELVASGACLSIGDLKVDGRALIALGVPEGPAVGDTLRWLLDQVLSGRAENQADQLLALARERIGL
ncbi:MAG: HD domain-containing protein [Clostridiales bacterium]|nr:HD domain-containing protein [Clostridiales bacterium]